MLPRLNQPLLLIACLIVENAVADPVCAKLKQGYVYDLFAKPKMGCTPQVKECPSSASSKETTFSLPALPPVEIDHKKSLDELREMRLPGQLFGAHRGRRASTVTAPFTKMIIEVEVKRSAGGGDGFCGAITSVSIGSSKTVTYIPTQYKEGTCPYETTLLHETRHYQDASAALDQMYNLIRGDIIRELNSGSQIPFSAKSAEEAEQILRDAVRGQIAAQRDWLKYKLQQDVDDFDTPARNEFDQSKCKTWPE